MGPSISGLDKLLKMPYGCGEQNMLNFAPNIFVARYLEVTSNLTPDLEDKVKGFSIKGMYGIRQNSADFVNHRKTTLCIVCIM
jgi:hypothetical protein